MHCLSHPVCAGGSCWWYRCNTVKTTAAKTSGYRSVQSAYLGHSCRLLLCWLVAAGRYAVVLPRMRLRRHKRLRHVKALLLLCLLLELPREAANMWHLWLLSWLLREGLWVCWLLTVAWEAAGSTRSMSLRVWLRHRCTIRRWRPILSLPIALLLPRGLHADDGFASARRGKPQRRASS
jgi:hypothetical protein